MNPASHANQRRFIGFLFTCSSRTKPVSGSRASATRTTGHRRLRTGLPLPRLPPEMVDKPAALSLPPFEQEIASNKWEFDYGTGCRCCTTSTCHSQRRVVAIVEPAGRQDHAGQPDSAFLMLPRPRYGGWPRRSRPQAAIPCAPIGIVTRSVSLTKRSKQYLLWQPLADYTQVREGHAWRWRRTSSRNAAGLRVHHRRARPAPVRGQRQRSPSPGFAEESPI